MAVARRGRVGRPRIGVNSLVGRAAAALSINAFYVRSAPVGGDNIAASDGPRPAPHVRDLNEVGFVTTAESYS